MQKKHVVILGALAMVFLSRCGKETKNPAQAQAQSATHFASCSTAMPCIVCCAAGNTLTKAALSEFKHSH